MALITRCMAFLTIKVTKGYIAHGCTRKIVSMTYTCDTKPLLKPNFPRYLNNNLYVVIIRYFAIIYCDVMYICHSLSHLIVSRLCLMLHCGSLWTRVSIKSSVKLIANNQCSQQEGRVVLAIVRLHIFTICYRYKPFITKVNIDMHTLRHNWMTSQ